MDAIASLTAWIDGMRKSEDADGATDRLAEFLAKAKAGPYPKKRASKNIEAHMNRMKQNPGKYPGGRKQAIAIGISQARAGKREPNVAKGDDDMNPVMPVPMGARSSAAPVLKGKVRKSLADLAGWIEKSGGAMSKRKRPKKGLKKDDTSDFTPAIPPTQIAGTN